MSKNRPKKVKKINPTTKDLEALRLESGVNNYDDHVTFRIEHDLKEKLRLKKINISKACREYLRKLVELDESAKR